jgi:hypothetical protein
VLIFKIWLHANILCSCLVLNFQVKKLMTSFKETNDINTENIVLRINVKLRSKARIKNRIKW